ncbi:uncharacterized protein LOC107422523 isoform X1 [Ziziphus jujuba]|uniref:Uncharacterized protein LOC107422523 isoform X1 n=1 Tax=Ziziphus jujuba TaxID=326968 RepID=A0A6P4A203_ZIZJJ|nr:uncharacterized protein LOC107422523 isoform X1 [Ziziphus jujuba]
METKQTPFREIGQRSIVSSLLSRSSNPFKVLKEDAKNEGSEKKSPVSFSDFLQRKLHQTSEPPRTVKEKPRPFSSLLGPKQKTGYNDEEIEAKKGGKGNTIALIDKGVLEQFKHTVTEKEHCADSSSCGETESCNISDMQESRKRKNSEGENEKYITPKHVAFLGGDPKTKQQRRVRNSNSKEKPPPLYNHYENGRGWWDSDMEGIDNEEVGLSEAWEGVGSTTLGGLIDWH